ncbi:DUF5765 domain-containing protein [Methylomonas methanica]|uniref:Uncharacterized protein n=1 Tax=Methylomonas methanica (strain DSM 25384 / MC09) TaxID=857087 RepID=G0A6X6_METMM|nr:DUF5765 domain-containing protein [Methylomonas methanica]AEG00597.1 hypothetical protein Metme_2193 [Methylomonas methanica MC09]
MCWSGEASAVLAVTGFASTVYFYRQGESKVLCMALAYFSLMELLQAYTYTVIDECFNPNNQIATFLGYMHIAFQPFFVNAVTMHFIPQPLRQRIAPYVYSLCFAAATIFMMRIYPFDWSSFCFDRFYQFLPGTDIKFSMPFCGKQICSTSGQWHIAWAIPASGSIEMANSYVYAAFLLPLLYGSWKLVLYHLNTGPLLAYLTTNNMNEWAAVWCLYSIGLLLLLIKTPARRYLHVTSWYGQAYPKFLTRERLEQNSPPNQ